MLFHLVSLFFIFSFIRPVKSDCPHYGIQWQNQCYIFVLNRLAFTNAEFNCIQLGGHLASIHDSFTNSFVAQQGLQYFGSVEFWIGARMPPETRAWTWTDDTDYNYNDFVNPDPFYSQNCGALEASDGEWYVQLCTDKRYSVCKVEPLHSSTAVPIITGSYLKLPWFKHLQNVPSRL